MKKQQGVALSGLMFWSVVIGLVALTAMRIFPAYFEYWKVKQVTKNVISQASPSSTVGDLKKAFDRGASIESISFPASDLDVSKQDGRIVISFSYERRVPLFSNVSLVIEFSDSVSQ